MKAAKDPIHGYLINPDLAAPDVILDFPNNYKAWLEARQIEMDQPQTVASEEEIAEVVDAQEIESHHEIISQIGTSSSVEAGSEKQIDDQDTQVIQMDAGDNSTAETQEFSLLDTGSKRKATDDGTEEPPEKIARHEDDAFVAAMQQHSDLITVNDADLTTTVVDVVTDTSISANIEVVADEGEDDLAAELPDGFYSTSCKSN